MKKKIAINIILALVIAFVLCMVFSCNVFASTSLSPDLYVDESYQADINAVNGVYNIIGPIVDILRVIGIGVALIILVWIGIQYVTGSPEGKAEYKKNFVPYIVGVVIIIAAEVILTIVKNFAGGITA